MKRSTDNNNKVFACEQIWVYNNTLLWQPEHWMIGASLQTNNPDQYLCQLIDIQKEKFRSCMEDF